jgi:hypothetical protein
MSAFQVPNDQPEEKPISSQTPIRLDLIILVLGGIFGFITMLTGAIWWASRVSTQLEGIEKTMMSIQSDATSRNKDVTELQQMVKTIQQSGTPGLQALQTKVTENQERLRVVESEGSPALVGRISTLDAGYRDITERVRTVELRGSPAVVPRLDNLEKEAAKMREDFELHKATLGSKKE